MKAVGYIRVSSEMQVKQGHSLDMQHKLIADFVQGKGWTLSDIWCETARSGRRMDRHALRMLLTRAKHGEFDVIVVSSLDRFYRNLMQLLIALEELRQHNVSFVSVTENIDFTTPWGKVALAVLGSLAEIYCDKLSTETKRGKQGRILKGLWNGSIPFGYCNGACSTCRDINGLNYCPHYGGPNRGNGMALIIHPIESIAVCLAFDWYVTRKCSDGLIAERLNGYVVTLPDGTPRHFRTKRCLARGGPQPFTRDSVRELLMRVFYTGRVPYFGTTAQGIKLRRHNPSLLRPGTHPALISTEVFERCQKIRQRLGCQQRPRSYTQRASFPLTGILFCGECGGHMIGARQRGQRRYHCNARIQHRVRCIQPSVNAELIEPTIVQVLSNLRWPNDWREQWRQVLESAWDEIPFLSDDILKWMNKAERYSKELGIDRAELAIQTPDQVTRQRSFEIDQLIEALEPLSAFRARWEIATSVRDDHTQKHLLRLAISEVIVRGQQIEQVKTSRALAHLLYNTNLAQMTQENSEPTTNKLLVEWLTGSSR